MTRAIILLYILFAFFSCKKSPGNNCTSARVTLSAASCKGVGVIIQGVKYPADDLPDQYAVEGKNICINYSFWDDETKCACCGGRKVHIISVH